MMTAPESDLPAEEPVLGDGPTAKLTWHRVGAGSHWSDCYRYKVQKQRLWFDSPNYHWNVHYYVQPHADFDKRGPAEHIDNAGTYHEAKRIAAQHAAGLAAES